MSYDTERVLVGREPLTVVDIILGSCSLTFGVAPCTATAAAGGECYNTRFTCADTANYAATTTTYRFCEEWYTPPPGIAMFPALVSWNVAPSKITPAKGLGHRASVSIVLKDFPHHDRGIDPYVSTRAAPSGTFFGRLLARNPYYQSRLIKIRHGYVAGDGLDLATDFEDHVYVIDKIDGPDVNGRVRITAKDMLKLVDDKRAQAPAASSERLQRAANSTTGILWVDDVTNMASSGTRRISGEILEYTGRNTTLNQITGCTRAQWGTTAASHSIGDTLQECVVYDGTNVKDVAYGLISNYTEVDEATYITEADWDTERDQWLVGRTVEAILSEPIGVNKLLGELTEQYGFEIWWDEIDQKITLKANSPPRTTRTAITDSQVIADSANIKRMSEDRLSQIWLYYSRINHADKGEDAENHRSVFIQADLEKEGTDLYGEPKIKTIYSRWINSDAIALAAISRTLRRYVDVPEEMEFELDIGATQPAMAEEIEVSSRLAQDTDGSNKAWRGQIMERDDTEPGSRRKYKAITSAFIQDRYGFIAPASTFTATATSDTCTSTGHGQSDTYTVRLETTGTLPAPLATGTIYYITNSAANTFQLASTSTGSAINITNTGTGTHTVKTPDYNDATTVQKQTYCWIAASSQLMATGDEPYRFI